MKRLLIALAVVVAAAGTAYWWFTIPHLHAARFGAEVDRYSIDSDAIGEDLGQIAVSLSGQRSRSLVVLLHGRGMSPEEVLSDEMFAALDSLGAEAPIVVIPSGGESSYWHDRSGGRWSEYVTDEVIPEALERYDVASERVAIGGISMGGFGALDLALDNPEAFCAVGAHSPAIVPSFGESAAGAFDSVTDFEDNDVLARLEGGSSALENVPVWIDVGEDDPFRAAAEKVEGLLGELNVEVSGGVFLGGHNEGYWWPLMDDYLDFYAGALDDC